MVLSQKTKNEINNLLVNTVTEKLRNYKAETVHAPFHYRLLGRDRYAIFSFIQSMNTTFGMSLWEQVAVILATNNNNYAERQYKLFGEIDRDTEQMIREIHYKLREGKVVTKKEKEIEQIRDKIKPGEKKKDPDSIVDLFLKIGKEENYFDITSVKPNMKEFVALKLKLLRWTALRLSQNKDAKVYTRIAIPYNPYYPEPYKRWTLKGLFDLNYEILVGEKFWNFVAQDNIYEELLILFEKSGIKLREKIDGKFAEFKLNR